MSFSEWKEIKLGELLNFRRGHDLPKTKMLDGNIPVVGSNGIIGFHNEVTTKAPCLTIGRSGNIGNPCYINKDCWAHNTSLYVDDFKGNDPKYLYYLLKTLNLGHYGGGSAVPTLNRNHIHPIEIKATINLAEQKAIAHILSTLDDKIEVNNEINKTLENMAQAIFKQWFVDFEFPNEGNEPYKSSGGEMIESDLGMIPKGWEVRTVDDITAKFTTGLNPRKNFVLGNGNNFYVTIKNMGNQRVFLDDRCDKIDDQALVIINKRSDLRKGDVLFSGIGTIGRTYLIDTIPKNWNISESIFTLRAYDERVSLFLYQLLLSESFQGYAKQLASGSVQKGIRMGDMKIFKFAYSESVVINNYHKIMSSVIDKIKVLQRENTMLSNLRETLLPKLMSGEIRVPLNEEGDAS